MRIIINNIADTENKIKRQVEELSKFINAALTKIQVKSQASESSRSVWSHDDGAGGSFECDFGHVIKQFKSVEILDSNLKKYHALAEVATNSFLAQLIQKFTPGIKIIDNRTAASLAKKPPVNYLKPLMNQISRLFKKYKKPKKPRGYAKVSAKVLNTEYRNSNISAEEAEAIKRLPDQWIEKNKQEWEDYEKKAKISRERRDAISGLLSFVHPTPSERSSISISKVLVHCKTLSLFHPNIYKALLNLVDGKTSYEQAITDAKSMLCEGRIRSSIARGIVACIIDPKHQDENRRTKLTTNFSQALQDFIITKLMNYQDFKILRKFAGSVGCNSFKINKFGISMTHARGRSKHRAFEVFSRINPKSGQRIIQIGISKDISPEEYTILTKQLRRYMANKQQSIKTGVDPRRFIRVPLGHKVDSSIMQGIAKIINPTPPCVAAGLFTVTTPTGSVGGHLPVATAVFDDEITTADLPEARIAKSSAANLLSR